MPFKPTLSERVLNKGINKLVEQELIDNQCSNFSVTPINAGTVNHNFYVADSNRECLFKVFTDNHILPIDRSTVFALQVRLAIIGLAPRPLCLSIDNKYYSEEWVSNSHTLLDEKRVLSKTLSEKEAITKLTLPLAEALYSVHNSDIRGQLLDLPKHLLSYWSQVKSPSPEFSKEFSMMLKFCEVYFKENKSNFVLCHNDLHLDHVCNKTGIIYDWEYASYGCKYYDIASCALINQFDEEQTRQLCAQYAQLTHENSELVHQAVQNVRKLTAFTFRLWHYAVGQEPILE